MVMDIDLKEKNIALKEKLEKIKLVITDNDGVLTDTGVYYSDKGEELKRFSIRDGMGVERLKNSAGIETIIVTGEKSGSVRARAKKLKINDIYLGVKNKLEILEDILEKNQISAENIAFIGDDVNDLQLMEKVGFKATPADGTIFIKKIADYICENKSGNGAFREFAELIIAFNGKNCF